MNTRQLRRELACLACAVALAAVPLAAQQGAFRRFARDPGSDQRRGHARRVRDAVQEVLKRDVVHRDHDRRQAEEFRCDHPAGKVACSRVAGGIQRIEQRRELTPVETVEVKHAAG